MAVIQVPNAGLGDESDPLRQKLRKHRATLKNRRVHLTRRRDEIDEELSLLRSSAADGVVTLLSNDDERA